VYGRTLPWLIIALILAGCEGNRAPKLRVPQTTLAVAASFDEATVGSITGRVVWNGDVPQVSPYLSPVNPLADSAPHRGLHAWPNPCAPTIDPNGGVADAVVMLRGVDAAKAHPWELLPVRVEIDNYQLRIRQGEAMGRFGFVRRGDWVDFVSKQAVFHSVQARGAAFFTIALPEADQVRRRTLSHGGVVELSSGAGHYWMRGYLFVVDNPYFTRTDANGYFTLWQAPPGKYEVVVWHPNWLEASHSRDADTCQICRVTLQQPLEVARTIEVGPRETRVLDVTLPVPHVTAQVNK
jgi:hypothetical protein